MKRSGFKEKTLTNDELQFSGSSQISEHEKEIKGRDKDDVTVLYELFTTVKRLTANTPTHP